MPIAVSPSRQNPNCEVVPAIFRVPTRRQRVEREFFLQDIRDGDDVLDSVQNGLVAYL